MQYFWRGEEVDARMFTALSSGTVHLYKVSMLAQSIPLSWKLTDPIVFSNKLLANKIRAPTSVQESLQKW
jgi:hypothetical protein